MKKIFTLVTAAVAALGINASAFELYFGDQPVENEATYETGYTVEEVAPGALYLVTQNANLFMHGAVGEEATITVQLLDGTGVQLCSFGDCINIPTPQGATTGSKSGALTKTVDDADIHKITTFYSDNFSSLQDVKIKVTATSGEYNTSVYVNLTAQPASLSAVVSEEYVKAAAGGTLNYNVAAPTTLNLYSITGALAGQFHISGAGSLNLGNLAKGVYIYTTGTHRGKLVVR